MRTYEVVVVLAPTAPSEDVDGFITQMKELVDGMGGKVVKVDSWGKKPLAYRIQKFRDGYYVIFTLEADGAMIAEMERRFRVLDSVIRYLSVRIDLAIKRAEKIRAMRRRKSTPTAPAPPPASPAKSSPAPETPA